MNVIKMETKYYTPSIEEFHVGFEFEVSISGSKNWSKETCALLDNLISIDSLIRKNRIRVKYLDREDIESLGWIFYKEFTTNWTRRECIGFVCTDEFGGLLHLDLIKNEDNKIMIHNAEEYEDLNCYFQGHIKTKSALKRLMKQIGITKTK